MTFPEKSDSGGVWIAYYPDWSGFAFFREEIDALRHAVEHEMKAIHVPFYQSVREWVAENQ